MCSIAGCCDRPGRKTKRPQTDIAPAPWFLRGWVMACVLAGTPALAQPVTYDDVAPVLAARCVMCHSGDAAPLALRLDSLDGVLKGSRNGAVVKAADPQGSELIRRLKGLAQPRMPMTGPPFLSDAEIGLFERWVASGLARGGAAADTRAAAAAPRRPAAGEPVTYGHVAPIFATRCVKCHTQNGLMGPPPEGYVLNSYAATLASADRARVVPGSAAASELVRRVRGHARPRMPFDGPPYLGDDDIALIAEWVEQGARDAQGQRAALPVEAQVRLHGTLSAPWRLDDLALVPGAATRRDGNPGVGDDVEVRGSVQADGRIVPLRIRRR